MFLVPSKFRQRMAATSSHCKTNKHTRYGIGGQKYDAFASYFSYLAGVCKPATSKQRRVRYKLYHLQSRLITFLALARSPVISPLSQRTGRPLLPSDGEDPMTLKESVPMLPLSPCEFRRFQTEVAGVFRVRVPANCAIMWAA